VQGIVAVVLRESVSLAVERERSVTDAVPIPSNRRPKERLVREVSIEGVVAQHDIFQLAGAIRNLEADHDSTEVRDCHFHAFFVGEGVKIDFSPIA